MRFCLPRKDAGTILFWLLSYDKNYKWTWRKHHKTKSAIMKTNQPKRRQSCRKNHAIKAGDFVFVLRMTRRRQMHCCNKSNRATSTPHAPRTLHTHTTKQSLPSWKLTKSSSVNPAGKTTPARLVIWFPFCAWHADVRCNVATRAIANIHTARASLYKSKLWRIHMDVVMWTVLLWFNKIQAICKRFFIVLCCDFFCSPLALTKSRVRTASAPLCF